MIALEEHPSTSCAASKHCVTALCAQVNDDTPVGIGNKAGFHAFQLRQDDGSNADGRVDCEYNCSPYSDYTGYVPRNSVHTLVDPSRWQPHVRDNGQGSFYQQVATTPQLGRARPFLAPAPTHGYLNVRTPLSSNANRAAMYKGQADRVLAASAALTDTQKMLAEWFNNKVVSYGTTLAFLVALRALSHEQVAFIEYASHATVFDAAVAI